MKKYVNVSAANCYRLPTFHSEVDTQAVLWEEVQVRTEQDDFSEIVCEDGYTGWINRRQLKQVFNFDPSRRSLITKTLLTIRNAPDENAQPIRDGAAGGYLLITERRQSWLRVLLPDGLNGWVPENACTAPPHLNRENMLAYAHTFLGVPYYWGGKTSKGFDCSGFVQLIHKMFGKVLRRDANMQYQDAHPISSDPLQGQPGDLLFFAENGAKITHVGFSLGKGKILHARGLVRINSLNPEDADFDSGLLKDFVEIRSFW